MKIAIFSDCYLDLTGGITSSINAQKTELERRGHLVHIYSSGFPRGREELAKLAKQQIFLVPSHQWFIRGILPVSKRPMVVEEWLVEEHPELSDFDIFYIHYEASCSIAGLNLAAKLGIPAVQVMHGREDKGEGGVVPFGFRTVVAIFLNKAHSYFIPHDIKIERDDYLADTLAHAQMWELMVNHTSAADIVLTPSKHFRDKLKYYGATNQIHVMPNGFPDERFPENPKPKKLLPGETLRIIWHSRVSSEKRIMPFLAALTKVRGKYHFDVYGEGSDLVQARVYAKAHKLNVVFHGNVEFGELESSMQKAHLDVLNSYNTDSFGMTLIEAEAYGTPVLICDPDMREIVPEGSYLMSENKTAHAMAKAINYVFEHPEIIQQMSEVMLNNREEVLISRRIEILEKIFAEIIKKNTTKNNNT